MLIKLLIIIGTELQKKMLKVLRYDFWKYSTPSKHLSIRLVGCSMILPKIILPVDELLIFSVRC